MTTTKLKRRPHWLKVDLSGKGHFYDVKELIAQQHLNTVCQSARCPNIGECWAHRTATFMILGNTCTRNCRFCAISHGEVEAVDGDEPLRVAHAVAELNLKYAVITSVTRDDLPDGGAAQFAATIQAIKKISPACKVEVLIPDFAGSASALKSVLDAIPDVLNHNVETVPDLYPRVRPQARYERSLELLDRSRKQGARTKSGLMVGLGETFEQVIATLQDLRKIDCQILTIGQYLQPSRHHLAVERFVAPQEFSEYKRIGLKMGFAHVESAPLVRSSYHADQQAPASEV